MSSGEGSFTYEFHELKHEFHELKHELHGMLYLWFTKRAVIDDESLRV
jgi:hypothetical protein